MFNTLRARIILTAAIPLLLIMPLLALFLISSLEDFYSHRLADELQSQGVLMVDLLSAQPDLARDPAALQKWLTHIDGAIATHVLVVSRDGIILGATEAEDRKRIGQVSTDQGIVAALDGQATSGSGYNPEASSDIAYVALPLPTTAAPLGALRLSVRLAESEANFLQLRMLVLGGTALSLLIALASSVGLAGALARPLRRLNELTDAALGGDYRQRAQPTGIVEVDRLSDSHNRLTASLAEQVALRRQLLADIAHELNRPLGALHAASEALLTGAAKQPELSRLLLAGMEAESARVGRLAQSLNDLSLDKIAAPQLNCSRVDVLALLRQTAARFRPEFEQSDIQLALHLPDVLPEVWADRDRATQVVNNLLDNARKFTLAGGQVTLSAGSEPSCVWVSVADTGCGIDAAERTRIFERFYRTVDAQPVRGMGLGLAIAQEIMQAHGGRIDVSSERGKGSTFTIRFPSIKE